MLRARFPRPRYGSKVFSAITPPVLVVAAVWWGWSELRLPPHGPAKSWVAPLVGLIVGFTQGVVWTGMLSLDGTPRPETPGQWLGLVKTRAVFATAALVVAMAMLSLLALAGWGVLSIVA
jgi:hypothetical protein